jgi:hypothetical protein
MGHVQGRSKDSKFCTNGAQPNTLFQAKPSEEVELRLTRGSHWQMPKMSDQLSACTQEISSSVTNRCPSFLNKGSQELFDGCFIVHELS